MLGMNLSPPLEQSSPSRNPFFKAQTSNDNDEGDDNENDNNKTPLDRSNSGITNSVHSKLPSESSNDDKDDDEEDTLMDSPSNDRQISSDPTSNNGLETQNPPIQVMTRAEDPASTTSAAESAYSYSYSSSSSASSSGRIPSHVFASDKSSFQWSTLSNESLFSIQMGNMSFTRDSSWLSKSGELDRSFIISGVGDIIVNVPSSNNLGPAPLPPKPQSQPQSQPQPVASRFKDMSLRVTEQQKGWRITEEKAAETMREVIMEESLRNGNLSPVNRIPYPIRYCDSSYSNNGSTKSFAFKPTTDRTRSPSLKHGMEEKPNQQKQLEQKNNIIAKETQTPPKSNVKASQKTWFSCFACCE
ncbi:hypothetical protein PIB30_002192 [Stylosanthes scabra]|uniref:Uncharacterized protein n=1 Tax=Stylosanthes scabra TaxID=79078 RepID=A0ABU6S2I4_9FABA|nr:hypothetical protein [Stylosanthes scabra]